LLRKKSRKQSSSQEPQKTKYLGINLTKNVKNFYNGNYKTLKKEIEVHTRKWKDASPHPYLWLGRINIVKMAILLKEIYRLKIPMMVSLQSHSIIRS
jgi:hypothetical protein